ncbi:hypothetical protein TURU_039482 [Turdus rufiventris]|nr:hypothetical protein TURU_039482 [Turdus rufiventris]
MSCLRFTSCERIMRYKEYKVLEESEPYTHETLLDANSAVGVSRTILNLKTRIAATFGHAAEIRLGLMAIQRNGHKFLQLLFWKKLNIRVKDNSEEENPCKMKKAHPKAECDLKTTTANLNEMK